MSAIKLGGAYYYFCIPTTSGEIFGATRNGVSYSFENQKKRATARRLCSRTSTVTYGICRNYGDHDPPVCRHGCGGVDRSLSCLSARDCLARLYRLAGSRMGAGQYKRGTIETKSRHQVDLGRRSRGPHRRILGSGIRRPHRHALCPPRLPTTRGSANSPRAHRRSCPHKWNASIVYRGKHHGAPGIRGRWGSEP